MRWIVFFDGYCHLCDGVVDFLFKIDKKKRLYFSPLQSDYAKKILQQHGYDFMALDTIAFYSEGGSVAFKARAIQNIFATVGGAWRILSWVMRPIPTFLLDLGYDLVAKYRYKIFGKKETCRMPTKEEAERFLS